MGQDTRLTLAGFLSTAVAFGPGRMGFGLFLPEFKEEFSLSTQQAGLIGSFSFLGFLISLLLASYLSNRYGTKSATLTGSACAVLGLSLVASAHNVGSLCTGIFLATASAGFLWSPYNRLTLETISSKYKDNVLAAISTGTTFGIIWAGLTTLKGGGESWRWAWSSFATLGAISLIANLNISGGSSRKSERSSLLKASKFFRNEKHFLYLVFSAGLTGSIYFSFATDYAQRIDSLELSSNFSIGAFIYLSYGAGGMIGLLTGVLRKNLGLRKLLYLIYLLSTLSFLFLLLSSISPTLLTISAICQGAFIMMISACIASRTAELCPSLASECFTLALVIFAFGNTLGPMLGGSVQSLMNYEASFSLAGICSLLSLGLIWKSSNTKKAPRLSHGA